MRPKRISDKQVPALERSSYMGLAHHNLEDIGYYLFSPDRLPILGHPEVVESGKEKALAASRLQHYLNETRLVERDIVNPFLEVLGREKLKIRLSTEAIEDIETVYTQEVRHSQVAS